MKNDLSHKKHFYPQTFTSKSALRNLLDTLAPLFQIQLFDLKHKFFIQLLDLRNLLEDVLFFPLQELLKFVVGDLVFEVDVVRNHWADELSSLLYFCFRFSLLQLFQLLKKLQLFFMHILQRLHKFSPTQNGLLILLPVNLFLLR